MFSFSPDKFGFPGSGFSFRTRITDPVNGSLTQLNHDSDPKHWIIGIIAFVHPIVVETHNTGTLSIKHPFQYAYIAQ
jgi:hypothetical protein